MNKSFLQSKTWGRFRNSLGQRTFWIKEKLLIKMPLILGQSYLYCPRCTFGSKKEFIYFLDEAEKVAKKEGVFFLRFEPECISSDINLTKFNIKQVESRQPAQTLLLNLHQTENEILNNTKQKTRYNIHLAEKKGVKIHISIDIKDIDIFYSLSEITAKRDAIKFYDKNYYKNFIDILGRAGLAKLYFASFSGKKIATAITICYKNIFYYLHGASSSEYRNVMAPYLLQWKMICDAKRQGCRWYDFWGTAPLKTILNTKYEIQDTDHAWVGITKFKLGFVPNEKTGKYIEYPGCFEVSYGKKRYLLYSMFKKVL